MTTVIQGQRPLFTDHKIVAVCLDKLRLAADETQFQVIAYCFMPDHFHLLLQASDDGNLVAFMRLFKQLSGYAYRRTTNDPVPLWQKSYYDHVLRREEDLHAVARYIWANPVRADLVQNAEDYPYSGSLTIHDEWRLEG